MITASVLTQLSAYVFYILLPLLALYIVYLIITKAFKDMGFTSLEAIIIVFASFLLGSGLFDEYVGFNFSNIYLFSSGNWDIGINTGGAIIPIILSLYLIIKSAKSIYLNEFMLFYALMINKNVLFQRQLFYLEHFKLNIMLFSSFI